ncbi:hypothetical protein [Planomicrobium sp. MB-3u-38]|uniref:hypothetical protein n=1 Tax=Planomicrobium sp. MB-3u-38 TaxID=2058318 RepID=UPI001E5E9FA8|nr:hypothetical protein [Planomicrobium sp. MB-3u-38]
MNTAEQKFREGYMGNQVTIIDYTEQGNSIYVNLEVLDEGQDKIYAEEVRFLDDLIYGDLVHAKRSPLTDGCRKETIQYLKNYFNR